MGEDGGEKAKKQHKKKVSGHKANKIKKKEQEEGKVKHNAKAHTFSGGVRSVHKRVLHTLERQSKKERAPKVDKNPDVPPPFVVVVQGPPGVGKSTLIRSLVRHYARQNLTHMGGPITLVSGRQRRLTIMECTQDVSVMLDLAKVADLVLVMIDASFGFELETFEFINILQVHGFPRVIGVLTHLDHFRDNKQLRNTKKKMKSRFWSELYDGAKLFHLSGLQYGRYHRLEVQNLARFIAVQKSAVLSWRQAHPYLVALRWEDQTDPTEASTAPRQLDLYGYVYGGRMRENMQAHLAGVGDFSIARVKQLPDPCPPPMDTEAEKRKFDEQDKDKQVKSKQKNALRTLAERHRVIYAPGSDVGSITVDSDAMYINVAEHEVGFTRRADEAQKDLPEAVRLVREMQQASGSVGQTSERLQLTGKSAVRITDEVRQRRPAPGSAAALEHAATEREMSGDEGEEGDADGVEGDDDSDDEDGEDDEESVVADEGDEGEGRPSLLKRARERFERPTRIEDIVYGGADTSKDETGVSLGKSARATDHSTISLFDDGDDDEDDDNDGRHADVPHARSTKTGGLLGGIGDVDGLDTSRMPTLPGQTDAWDEARKAALKERKFITGGWDSAEEDNDEENAEDKEAGVEDDKEGKEGKVSDSTVATPAVSTEQIGDAMPIAAFVRIRLENVPAACVAELRKDRPLVLGGLLPGETRMSQLQMRVKRHRWHPKLLKSNDALLVSIGWRRFQTMPTFSIEDRGEKRMRFLKYTLEHAHCHMTIYGPAVPPNTGVMAFRTFGKMSHFRVSATGGVLETAPNFEVMKKLKLVGEPYKVFKNTAFVRNMFTSDLEVAKYSHTKIQTVSGIRGEIKKAEGNRGNFRASFEDRILMSDLVVCKCWINVEPKKFYHPVVDVAQWRPARLIGELRVANSVAVPDNKDSRYGAQIVRPERKFNPLKIPKALEVALPFKSKPKDEKRQVKSGLKKKTAVISSVREKAVNTLLDRLYKVRKEKARKRKDSSQKKKVLHEKRQKFIQDKRDAHTKETKRRRYVKQGQEEKKGRERMNLD